MSQADYYQRLQRDAQNRWWDRQAEQSRQAQDRWQQKRRTDELIAYADELERRKSLGYAAPASRSQETWGEVLTELLLPLFVVGLIGACFYVGDELGLSWGVATYVTLGALGCLFGPLFGSNAKSKWHFASGPAIWVVLFISWLIWPRLQLFLITAALMTGLYYGFFVISRLQEERDERKRLK